ncbi:MAG: cysteine desulfurase [Candidatus Vogelbacteria bacterium]|nr:cysteine desulfurase [Candidatus Vogelbacteria bacterium]
MKRIYLDTAAGFNNPSSIHVEGVAAAKALDSARALTAAILGTRAEEIIFTSGGTESNNLAIFGLVRTFGKGHIITTAIEHASVLEPCRSLEREGWAVTYLPVKPDGLTDPAVFARALRPDTVLVSIAYANNEIGVIQPLRELARVVRKFRNVKHRNVQHRMSNKMCDIRCLTPIFHTDACQAPRFLDCRVPALGVDMMTLNSGKIYGPKGVGCLYVRQGIKLSPLLLGGGQERGLRSGTENVPGIVGLAAALRLGAKLREKESVRLAKLRDYFIEKLLALPGVVLNGSAESRLPNNINVSFVGADSEYLVLALDAAGVACSSGSACSTHLQDSSYVIQALGGNQERARSAVRFTLGRDTTKRDLDYVLKILPGILSRSRVEL